mgnify:CR=1 FL=1
MMFYNLIVLLCIIVVAQADAITSLNDVNQLFAQQTENKSFLGENDLSRLFDSIQQHSMPNLMSCTKQRLDQVKESSSNLYKLTTNKMIHVPKNKFTFLNQLMNNYLEACFNLPDMSMKHFTNVDQMTTVIPGKKSKDLFF